MPAGEVTGNQGTIMTGRDISELAKLGGFARAEKLSAEEKSDIGKYGASKRWEGHETTLPKAKYEAVLKLGDAELPVAVLADGTRLMTRIGFIRAMGRKGKAKGGRRYDMESQLPVFLTAKNLKAFISDDLIENSKPIPFKPLRGGQALGYRADLLPLVCNVFMDAKEAGVLKENQIAIADACRALNRAFATVGLAALIDEVTGAQKDRNDDALQAMLDLHLRKQFAAWARRFPEEFYKHIYRLNQWEYRPSSKGRHTQLVGKYTKNVIYERLLPGIVAELESRNPITEKGYRKTKHHQWLTDDIGHPALAQHLHAVIGFMRATDTWRDFKKLIDRSFPVRTRLDDLPLFSASNDVNG